MRTFDIEVMRDGRWWMIHVPELDGYVAADGSINIGGTTQARQPGEVEDMGRGCYIAAVLDIPVKDVAVRRIG
ncbi:hypothetical protein [Mycobacterium sp. E740]|uniref:hypothetical protein n=1 Tax=Mycobacterium sp. E740 TaxID=1834149 RepID=UPI0007FBA237|nr:hypothetical protein [Mycobacterium sp. E740]OBI72808.1 hypothetical protein A5663_07645 [Mycobacterium sp. E740]